MEFSNEIVNCGAVTICKFVGFKGERVPSASVLKKVDQHKSRFVLSGGEV